jgi:hypothetical protein
MNLLSLPDGRIINLEHLTYAERAGEYLALHFDSGAEGGMGCVVRLKQGEGARRGAYPSRLPATPTAHRNILRQGNLQGLSFQFA